MLPSWRKYTDLQTVGQKPVHRSGHLPPRLLHVGMVGARLGDLAAGQREDPAHVGCVSPRGGQLHACLGQIPAGQVGELSAGLGELPAGLGELPAPVGGCLLGLDRCWLLVFDI